MSKKQTAVAVDRENVDLNKTPYLVSVAGQVDSTVKAYQELNPRTGDRTISVQVPTVHEGLTESAKFADSTLDAIARRINPKAKIFARSALEFGRYQRVYTVTKD